MNETMDQQKTDLIWKAFVTVAWIAFFIAIGVMGYFYFKN